MAMTLRLTDEETAALRAAAEREHRSMQDVARTAVAEYVGRRTQLRDELIARHLEEDEALLDRLRQT